MPNWDVLRVPALRRESIERLRRVDRARLDELGVVAHFERDYLGVMHPAQATGNLGADKGVRIEDRRVQFGLTRDEIDEIERRIQELLKAADAGLISLF